MLLYLPQPDELSLLYGGDRFRDWGVVAGALPGRALLRQGLQNRDAGSLAYRWSVPYLIVVPGASRVVGTIGGKGLLEDEEDVEIAYNVAAPARGQGYASQAIALLQGYARRDALQLLAHVEPDNLPSRRLLRTAGFTFEATFCLPDSLDLERWRWSPD